MRCLRWTLFCVLSLHASFAAAELHVMKIDEFMALDDVKEVLDPGFKLLWGDQKMVDVVERAPEDGYTDSSRNAFPGSKSTCTRAFIGVVKKIIKEGKAYGFDQAWFHARPAKGLPPPAGNEFICDNGFRTTEVGLLVTFGLSKAGLAVQQAQRNDPAREATIAAQVAQRKAAGKTVFLPLASLLDSPEAKAMLGMGESVHWGRSAPPAYELRKGPDRFSEDASYKEHGRDKACHAAGLRALKEMIENMREGGFNAIIRVHSLLDDLPALDDEYECEMDRSEAEVRLFATLVKKSAP